MRTDYSSVTLHLPAGYYTRHLGLMDVASARFRRMKIHQGDVLAVEVIGHPESAMSREVDAWAALHLPPA